jgi:hypothetical protein
VIYSVYNYGSKAYDYFEAPAKALPHAPKPPQAAGASTSLGATPEQAAWPLPMGAKLVGHGKNPVGRIAFDRGVAGSLDGFMDNSTNVVGFAAAAYLVWRFFLKKG